MRAAAIALAALLLPAFAHAQQKADPAPSGDPQPPQRGEPQAIAPSDPLAISPETKERIGSDFDGRPAPAQGELKQRFAGYYEESRGDYRFRLLPPFYLEHTRGLADPNHPERGEHTDRESLISLLYYQRRSAATDADIVFPLFWRIRSGQSHFLDIGPFVHREVYEGQNPHAIETDNWLAPLYFEGTRKDGGYFHAPLLLTTSHWSKDKAFTYSLLYFRDRKHADVDTGVVPFYFHGDNGDQDGARRSYTLIPPLLYFHRERELTQSSFTVAANVVVESDTKRDIVDVLPFFFHIKGKPASGGIREEHTTLFPFFHYGYTDTESLFASLLYFRRITPKVDTLLTPLFSRVETRRGSTSLTLVGPILPLYGHYEDKDIGSSATGLFPFFFKSDSPSGHDWLTPLAGHFETAGVSKTTWVFPTLTVSQSFNGWETDLHPLFYFGRSGDSTHTVITPAFMDFASPRGRSTVAFPVFWRFSDTSDSSVVQLAANTLYLQKRVPGGLDWSFHVLPLFSYGEDPTGYFWNFVFGLAGYSRHGNTATVRALWLPIDVSGAPPQAQPPRQAADVLPAGFH